MLKIVLFRRIFGFWLMLSILIVSLTVRVSTGNDALLVPSTCHGSWQITSIAKSDKIELIISRVEGEKFFGNIYVYGPHSIPYMNKDIAIVGEVKGSRVTFEIVAGVEYHLTLSENGKELSGDIRGGRYRTTVQLTCSPIK